MLVAVSWCSITKHPRAQRFKATTIYYSFQDYIFSKEFYCFWPSLLMDVLAGWLGLTAP